MRYFVNPYPDYDGSNVIVDTVRTRRLIEIYVNQMLQNRTFSDGDLYVGSSGIAYMFLKLHQSHAAYGINQTALQNAKMFIDHSKNFLRGKPEDAVSFLCGNAGINAVSAVIHKELGDTHTAQHDLNQFLSGVSVTQKITFNKHGNDEILFGRAGYLSGIFWLNQNLPQRISLEIVTRIVDVMIEAGIQFSHRNKLNIPMMWECYGDKYLGAAHGISAILHTMLETPLSSDKMQLVKASIDVFLQMQTPEGNFPCTLEDTAKSEHKLIHWCHGASGVIYLFAKAYIVFKEQKYLDSCLKSGDLVWSQGLLRKGPGICHGISGSGYVFLLLYRLTGKF